MDSPKVAKKPQNKSKKLDKKDKNWKHDHMDLRRIKRKMQKKAKNEEKEQVEVEEKIMKLDESVDSSQKMQIEDQKLKKSDLKNARKQEKYKGKGDNTFFDSSLEIKKIWEDLRKIEGTKSEKGHELAEEIFKVLKTKEGSQGEKEDGYGLEKEDSELSEALLTFCRKHDTSRIIQGILNKGSPNLRLLICNALLSKFNELINVKYANFVAEKMLSCIAHKKTREEFLFKLAEKFLDQNSKGSGSKLGKLIKDPYAGPVLEQLFSNYSNDKTKSKIKTNFFGKDYLTKCERHLGGNTENYSLVNLLEQLKNDDDKLEMLKNVSTLFESFLEREALQNHSLIHACMLDFSNALVKFGEGNEKIKILKTEFFTSLREVIPFIAHTSYGCQVSNQIIWSGSAKDRKVIIKALQKDEKIPAMLKNKYASIVILCLLDSVDDTRLLSTSIIDKVAENFKNVAFITQNSDDIHCKKVIHYISSGRIALHKESIRKMLMTGDDITTSKKDSEIRQKEILLYFAKKVIGLNFKDDNDNTSSMNEFLNQETNSAAVLLSDMIVGLIKCQATSTPEFTKFIQNFLNLLIQDIEKSSSSFILRWVLKSQSDKKDQIISKFVNEKILNDEEVVKSFLLSNRGCFALVQVIEAMEGVEGVDLEKFKKSVKGCIRQQGKKVDKKCKGYEVLSGKI